MKTSTRLISFTAQALAVLVIGVGAGSAWATPGGGGTADQLTLTNISTTPSSTVAGQNHNVGDVNAGDNISLSFTVGVSVAGTATTYSHPVYITAPTLVGSDVTVTGLSNCTLATNTATCTESATLTAPSTPGAYQVKILADDGLNGTGSIKKDFFFINFTVVAPSCTPAATSLVLSTPACVIYKANSVSLSATLTSGGTGIGGKIITFLVEGNSVGTATTDSSGLATLTYDPSSLAVGDYALSAAWLSDDTCSYYDPTVTGGTLGVQYLFVGFQQPINADGSSVFSGKVVPVKIKIADYNGAAVPDGKAFVYFNNGTPAIVGTDVENVASSINFDAGYQMRYDSVANQYVYNWDLSTAGGNGTKNVRVDLGEGSCAAPRQVTLSVNRKGK